MSSAVSQDRPTLEELAPIRTQGLIGIVLVLITLGSMTYYARSADTHFTGTSSVFQERALFISASRPSRLRLRQPVTNIVFL